MTPIMLEWYRIDPTPRIVRVLAVAAPMLLTGCLLVAFAWLARRPTEWRIAAGIVGALLNIGGPLYAILGLRRLLEVDHFIALRTDAIEVQLGAHTRLIVWDALREARHEAGALVLELEDEEPICVSHSLRGITMPQLAKRIEHTRRKIALGLKT